MQTDISLAAACLLRAKLERISLHRELIASVVLSVSVTEAAAISYFAEL